MHLSRAHLISTLENAAPMPFSDAMELGPQRLSSQMLSAESLQSSSLHACVHDGLEDNHAGRQKWPAYVQSVHNVHRVYM